MAACCVDRRPPPAGPEQRRCFKSEEPIKLEIRPSFERRGAAGRSILTWTDSSQVTLLIHLSLPRSAENGMLHLKSNGPRTARRP